MKVQELKRAVLGKIDEWSYGIWQWANDKLAGPQVLCPDCNLLRPIDEAECAVCRDHWEQQQRDKELYRQGYEDALSRDGDWWP